MIIVNSESEKNDSGRGSQYTHARTATLKQEAMQSIEALNVSNI